MAALGYTHAANLLNTSLRGSTVYLALFLTDPTAGGTGNEATGGGYARKSITFGAPTQNGAKTQVSNSAAVDFGTMNADIGNVGYWGIYSASTGGTLLWFGEFTAHKDIYSGDAINVPIGNIVCTIE